jgi:O-antigen/teichoic acid export membrane protein
MTDGVSTGEGAGGSSRSPVRNYLSLLTANSLSQFLNFLTIVYLARAVGVGAFGQVSLAQAIGLYFKLIADMGLEMLGTRRVAADRTLVRDHVASFVGFRLMNTALAWLLLLAFLFAVRLPDSLKWLVLGYGVSLLTFPLLLEWVFIGLERMEFVAVSRFTAGLVYLVLVVAFVRGPGDVVGVPLAYAGGLGCGALAVLVLFWRQYGPFSARFSLEAWRRTLREALPMGLSFITIQVYYSFGIVFLGFLEGDRATGLYAAPLKIVLFLTGLAALFGSAIFPRLVVLRALGRGPFDRFVLLSARAALLIGLPLAVGGTLVAPSLTSFLFGPGYVGSIPVFRILFWTTLTVFANVPFAYALLACGRQKAYFISVLAGALVNVLCNLLLIPSLHSVGAAISTMCCEVVVLALLWAQARAVTSVDLRHVVTVGAEAAAVMVVALLLVRSAPLSVQVAVGATTYLAALFVFKGVTRTDVVALCNAVRGG